jgi:predicted permease
MLNLKLAVRRLLKSPLVSTVAILSLALGIGANAAIFSMFHEMLRRPLPVHAPLELVNLSAPGPKPGSQSCNDAGGCDVVFSYPMFRDLETQQTVFTGLAAHRLFGVNVGYRNDTREGRGMLVSGSYFGVVGLQPALGRLINPSDEPAIGEAEVAVLSHDYWTRRFNTDTGIVGESIVVNGVPMTVIGVAPEGFHGTTITARPDIFVPITLRGRLESGFDGFENRRSYWVYLFARLRPGVTIEQARAELGGQYRAIVSEVEAPLQAGMSEATMREFLAKEIAIEDGRRGQSGIDDAAVPLTMLLLGTFVVLLIACANVANLLLARSAARSTEMAVRLSIGASRRSLIGQLLTESLVLAALGGLAGLVVASWTLQGIVAMMPPEAAEFMRFGLNGTALLFAAALALGTGLLFGLFPALHASRPDLLQVVKGSTGQPSGSRSAAWFRVGLATSQIALSMALLGTAGLFVKSLANVSRVELGVDVENVVTFRLSPDRNGYPLERSRQLFDRVEDALRAQPGATDVSAALVPLLGGSSWGSNVSVQGFEAGPDTNTNARFNEVGPGYFRTIGVPILAGRDFQESDRDGTPGVAIVNEAFAAQFDLGRNPVGTRMEVGNDGDFDLEIVGVVQDAKYNAVKDDIPPQFFLPYKQTERNAGMTFYVRTSLDPDQFVGTIQPLVARLDPNLPVEDLRTMPEQIRQNVFEDRIVSVLSAAFAVLATVLAAVGLYGVLAYTVAQRTREFGLRMALGAEPRGVLGLVMKRVAWMTLAGTAAGITLALYIGSVAESILFEMEANDPLALGGSALVLAVVALGAGFIPAWRASRVSPMRALRYE